MLTAMMLVALTQLDGGAPADAPLRQGAHLCGTRETAPDGGLDADRPGCAVILSAGTPAPYLGVELDEQEDVRRARRDVRDATKVKIEETGNFIMPTGAYLGITGGAVSVAIALTLAALAASGHLK
jgi:hypothetical protein